MNMFKEWLNKRTIQDQIRKVSEILIKLITTTNKIVENLDSPNETQSNSELLWGDEKFLQWLNQNGVDWVKGRVPKHSDGGVGRAYFLGEKVVKFTNNRVEANVANMVAGNPESPTRVHAVYRVPARPLWAILQDKVDMQNVPKMIAKASDLLMTYVSDTDIDQLPQSAPEKKKLATKIIKKYKNYGATSEVIPHMMEIMGVMEKLYRQTGFFHDDAVPQNLGAHKDKIVIPDLGPNQPKTFNARKALDKIHKRRSELGLPDYQEI